MLYINNINNIKKYRFIIFSLINTITLLVVLQKMFIMFSNIILTRVELYFYIEGTTEKDES